jgi:hypothetical protein
LVGCAAKQFALFRNLEDLSLRSHGLHGILFPPGGTPVKEFCGGLSVYEWQSLCIKMIQALRSLHTVDIVHGDVKLSNFCYTIDSAGDIESVSLIDYGMQFFHFLIESMACQCIYEIGASTLFSMFCMAITHLLLLLDQGV